MSVFPKAGMIVVSFGHKKSRFGDGSKAAFAGVRGGSRISDVLR